jgi:uncharacterized protein involved in type VI secretion and phage assembly
MQHLLNQVRAQALAVAAASRAATRIGIVDGYDPTNYCVKVRLQPEDSSAAPGSTLTGWLPILSPFVGAGWGMVAGPTAGDVVDVHFQEGGHEAGFVCQRFFGDAARPPGPCPSGEFWLTHKSGSLLKFHNDGSVEVTAAGNLTLTAGQTLRLAAPTIQVHATNDYRFDVNGHGQHWYGGYVDTWQIGETAGTPHPISPAEIG